MITRLPKRNKLKGANTFVEPDEIFLDSKNIQNFDRQQFEGRIEKPISKSTILFLGIFFLFCALAFCTRLGYLQIEKGQAFTERALNNSLEKQIIFADRGIIYDRNKVVLAGSKKGDGEFSLRTYMSPGFSHLLGYIGYPQQDKMGNYWQSTYIGKDGLEQKYDSILNGTNGSKTVEKDSKGEIHSENVVDMPKIGTPLVTTIDSRIQTELFSLIKNISANHSFNGGAGVIMDIGNGEILTSTSYPEYNGEILSLGKDSATISAYFSDKRKVFLDRTISGLYTPGSIIKPFLALGALTEGIIDPLKKILSTGSISIPNPYFPDQKTVFKDWRANGWTNMAEAISVSSDVYFYTIGGGYGDQPGLGIANIEKYAKLFGIGTATGVDLTGEKGGTIPSPEWKLKNFPGDPWRIGDTYHTAIGQYGFQTTPMEMTRATAAIANDGTLVQPHFVLGDTAAESKVTKLDLKKENFDVVQQGMRLTVTAGTAMGLNVPYVQVAAKTGTAQLGTLRSKENSWVIGFFPYDHPKYAFTILMEAGPVTTTEGASSIMGQLLNWMSVNTPEYFK